MTPNGKVDRRGLPFPGTTLIDRVPVRPQTPVEKILERIWAGVLRVDRVGIHDDFFELGGHSLRAARLFVEIEKRFGKTLPVSSLLGSPTIATQAVLIQQRDESAVSSSLIALQPRGRKRPFFLVHPHSGNVLHFRELARHLGTEQPLYGLQARGLDGRAEPHGNIEEMAADYIAEIRAVQSKGPYLLGGHCLGGTIAFEMAQQLRAAEEKVSLLVLFDAPPPAGLFERSLTYYFQRVRYHLRNGPLRLPSYVREGIRQRMVRFRVAPFELRCKSAVLRGLALIERTNMVVREAYVAQSYPGRITCFWSDELAQLRQLVRGWATLAGNGVDAHVIAGTAPELFAEPCVQHLAEGLKTLIAESCDDDLRSRGAL